MGVERSARWIALACLVVGSAFLGSLSHAGSPRKAAARAQAAAFVVPSDLARIQMYRNGLRGLHYAPTPGSDEVEPDTFKLTPRLAFPLDGDPIENDWGNVYPIDVDGDGQFEFLHYNGFRMMRVYDAQGVKLWEIRQPGARIHRSRYHRDTLAVMDVDGDGAQEVVHCWGKLGDSAQRLVIRDGATGTVLRSAAIAGASITQECQLGVFPMVGGDEPLILVSRRSTAAAGCKKPELDNWSRVTAYDLRLRTLWDRTSCDAGHYAWPLDQNQDGVAEAVFVGKYLFDRAGTLLCKLADWGTDHVDSMVVADLDASSAGLEAVAVGTSGTRFYRLDDFSSCPSTSDRLLDRAWRVTNTVVPSPQVTSAARINSAVSQPAIFVQERGAAGKLRRVLRLNSSGVIVGSYSEPPEPTRGHYQTVNLDGVTTAEDRLAAYGRVVAIDGRIRLDADWYWNLQGLTEAEQQAIHAGDQWTFTPLAVDLDRDGRDELIVWGRRLLVVGSRIS